MRRITAAKLALLSACSILPACARSDAGNGASNPDSAAAAVGARSADRPAHARVEEFLPAYIAAVNARDTAQRLRLMHPACAACISSETRDFYDRVLWRAGEQLPAACATAPVEQLAAGAPLPVSADEVRGCNVRLQPIAADAPLLLEGELTYPVRPTHRLQIEYGNRSKIIQLIQEGSAWSEVVPCPTPEALRKFRERRAKPGA